MTTPHQYTLAQLFHLHEPPELFTLANQYVARSGGSSRHPSAHSAQVFASLPTPQLHVQHSPNILTDLATLLASSWSDTSLSSPIGSSWDVKLNEDTFHARHSLVKGEVVDLSGIYSHFLFSPVNLVASREYNALISEAYPRKQTMVAMWGSPVDTLSSLAVRADDCATLKPWPPGAGYDDPVNTVASEKKAPHQIVMPQILNGMRKVVRRGGCTITRTQAGEYQADAEMSSGFISSVVQVCTLSLPFSLAFCLSRLR